MYCHTPKSEFMMIAVSVHEDLELICMHTGLLKKNETEWFMYQTLYTCVSVYEVCQEDRGWRDHDKGQSGRGKVNR